MKEYLFKKLLPWCALGCGIYWFIGDSEMVRLAMVIGWFVVVMTLIVCIIKEWL